jgi:hypothetical protein
MTREEEIKARLFKEDAKYVNNRTGKMDIKATEDLMHLLDRNEELQRRVGELESAMKELQDDPYVYNVPRLVGIIQNILDAKEQDDD